MGTYALKFGGGGGGDHHINFLCKFSKHLFSLLVAKSNLVFLFFLFIYCMYGPDSIILIRKANKTFMIYPIRFNLNFKP